MSGLVHGAAKKVRREKEKLFSMKLLGSALGDIEYAADGTAEAADGDDKSLHTESYDLGTQINAAMQKSLGPLYAGIHKVIGQINLKAPQPMLVSAGPTPPAVAFTFTVTTSAAIWKLIEENARWKQDRDAAFDEIVQDRIGKCCVKIEKAGNAAKADLDRYFWMLDQTGRLPEQKYLDSVDDSLALFDTEAAQQVDIALSWVESQFANWLYARIKREHKNVKAIVKTRGRKGAKVGVATGVIAGHAAHAAASWGATAPLAIVAILRQGIEIGNIAVRANMSLKSLGKEIDGRVNLLVANYVGSKKKLGAIETLQNLAKGALGIDMPSIASCKDLIEEYEHKTLTLEASYNQLQRELAKATQLLDFYKTELKMSVATLSKQDREGALKMIYDTRETCSKLERVSENKDKRAQQAKENVKIWNGKLDQIDLKVGKEQKLATAVGSLAVSVALGTGDASGAAGDAVDAGKSAAEAVVEQTHSFLIEMGMWIAELPPTVMEVFQRGA
jgi:uncharacterized lipoprotein YehR (DUF1307 family)